MTVVAHIVREGNALTEPFIARRVAVPVGAWTSEQWSEAGEAPDGIELIRIKSRLISPGGAGSRAFHRLPLLGTCQSREYRAVANARRPDLVHAHYLTTGHLAAPIGRPLVVSAYGFDVSVLRRRAAWRRALEALGSRVGAVLVEGPHMRDSVVELGMPVERVRVVPIAAGHERIAFREPAVPTGDGLVLLAAGRFVEKKGFALAIGAFAVVASRWPAARLRIVGSGPLEDELRRIAAASGHANQIEFLGRLPRAAYLALMTQADLFLAPSVTARNGDSEGGAPTTILDAQASGTIVIGSTHADIPFLVTEGETGFLAPEADLDGLIAAIERAVAASDRWPGIAAAARAAVLARHTDAVLAEGLAAAYADALR